MKSWIQNVCTCRPSSLKIVYYQAKTKRVFYKSIMIYSNIVSICDWIYILLWTTWVVSFSLYFKMCCPYRPIIPNMNLFIILKNILAGHGVVNPVEMSPFLMTMRIIKQHYGFRKPEVYSTLIALLQDYDPSLGEKHRERVTACCLHSLSIFYL